MNGMDTKTEMPEAMIDEALATRVHEAAMAYAHQAAVASDSDEAARLYRLAYEHERQAADLLEQEQKEEPTRSILYRSAATLALDCKEYDEAERLIDKGLAGSPPADVAEELRELREKVSLERPRRESRSYRIFLSHSSKDS